MQHMYVLDTNKQMHQTMLQTCAAPIYMCYSPCITGPDTGISARLMHVACMTHMHITTACVTWSKRQGPARRRKANSKTHHGQRCPTANQQRTAADQHHQQIKQTSSVQLAQWNQRMNCGTPYHKATLHATPILTHAMPMELTLPCMHMRFT